MSDMPTIVETNKDSNGWGNGWGAGVGGFLGSVFGNGGFGWGGWGGNGRAMQAGADVAMANQLEHVSDQIQQGVVAGLQSAGATQLQVANSGNAQALATAQGFAGMGQQVCCSTGRLSQEIDANGDRITDALHQNGIQGMQNAQLMADRLCATNQNIVAQGYEGRIQNQNLAAQLQGQHADLKATIIEQGCQDRETMREIAAQAVRDKLAEAQAKIAQLETQGNLTAQLQNQTLYLIQQLKPTTTTAAGA